MTIPVFDFHLVVWGSAVLMLATGFLWGSLWTEGKLRRSKTHVHTADSWDGYYEFCRCGACAGDRRSAKGRRCISFAEWPPGARKE